MKDCKNLEFNISISYVHKKEDHAGASVLVLTKAKAEKYHKAMNELKETNYGSFEFEIRKKFREIFGVLLNSGKLHIDEYIDFTWKANYFEKWKWPFKHEDVELFKKFMNKHVATFLPLGNRYAHKLLTAAERKKEASFLWRASYFGDEECGDGEEWIA